MRKTNYEINALFLKRWSPRAMSGDVSEEELMRVLEAARWAPSSFNNQPWRFIYGLKKTKEFEKLSSLLFEGNNWALKAGALVLIISKKTFDRNSKPYNTYSLEAGSAWQNAALQATDMGLYAHGMGGFDYEKARKEFGVPEDYNVEMMFAIGKLGDKEELPKELANKEAPSDRKPLNEIVFKGKFK